MRPFLSIGPTWELGFGIEITCDAESILTGSPLTTLVTYNEQIDTWADNSLSGGEGNVFIRWYVKLKVKLKLCISTPQPW